MGIELASATKASAMKIVLPARCQDRSRALPQYGQRSQADGRCKSLVVWKLLRPMFW